MPFKSCYIFVVVVVAVALTREISVKWLNKSVGNGCWWLGLGPFFVDSWPLIHSTENWAHTDVQ